MRFWNAVAQVCFKLQCYISGNSGEHIVDIGVVGKGQLRVGLNQSLKIPDIICSLVHTRVLSANYALILEDHVLTQLICTMTSEDDLPADEYETPSGERELLEANNSKVIVVGN